MKYYPLKMTDEEHRKLGQEKVDTGKKRYQLIREGFLSGNDKRLIECENLLDTAFINLPDIPLVEQINEYFDKYNKEKDN